MIRYVSAAGAILFTLVSAEAFAQGGPRRVTICHLPPGNPANGQTLTLPEPAIQAHLAHGDVIGACGNGRIRGGNPVGGESNAGPRTDGRGTTGRRGGSEDQRPQGGAREEAGPEEAEDEDEVEEREGGDVSPGNGRKPGSTTARPGTSERQPSGGDRGGRGGKPQPGHTGGTGRGAPSTKKPAAPPSKRP
jgi:hypothetical protein